MIDWVGDDASARGQIGHANADGLRTRPKALTNQSGSFGMLLQGQIAGGGGSSAGKVVGGGAKAPEREKGAVLGKGPAVLGEQIVPTVGHEQTPADFVATREGLGTGAGKVAVFAFAKQDLGTDNDDAKAGAHISRSGLMPSHSGLEYPRRHRVRPLSSTQLPSRRYPNACG